MTAKSVTVCGLLLILAPLAGVFSALIQEPQPFSAGPPTVMLASSDLARPVFAGQSDPLPGQTPPRHIAPRPESNPADDPPVYDERSFLPLVHKRFDSRLTWYVDSVNGDDANDGKRPSAAFQTLAALQAAGIAPGDKIALARGSHWREQLTITAAAVTVDAYGTGDRPLLDASNIAANASFSKTAGQTHVYQIPITPEWNGSGKDFVNAWEDDAVLVRAADVAACDATAGSYALSGEGSGTVILYVHASDSSAVTANGKTYEYSHRKFGLDTRDASHVTLSNLQTRRNLHADGSLRVGPYGRASDINADDGSAHNVLVERGAQLVAVEARNAYHPHAFSMFVLNSDSPASEGVRFVDCAATNSSYNANCVGFSSHYNTSGTFGAVIYDHCTVTNCFVAFSPNHAASVALTNCTTTGTAHFLRDNAAAAHTISGGSYTFSGANGRVLDGQAAGTVTFDGFTATITDPGAAIFFSSHALTLTLTGCQVTNNASAAANHNLVYLTNAGASFAATGNRFKTPNLASGPYTYFFSSGLAALNSDQNCFGQANQWFRVGAENYGTVAAYQAGTGQDIASTVGNCP